MPETPTNQQLYDLFKALDTRVETMDGDHTTKLNRLRKDVNELQTTPKSDLPE